jgi:hypothetical protein
MNRLYQWLSKVASSSRLDTPGRGIRRIARTEVTVERQDMILLAGGAVAAGFDTCPLCGSKLAPAQEQLCGRLLKGAISQETGPIDSPPP